MSAGDRRDRKWGDRYERARKPTPVKDLVDGVVERNHLQLDIREERLFTEWTTFVGDKVGARTRPETIVDRTLIVEVANHAWLHELRLIRPKIVSDLLDQLGMPRFFDDIRFVLAKEHKRREPRRAPPPRRSAPPPRPLPAPASGAALEQIVRDAARVEDPELRELIATVRMRHDK